MKINKEHINKVFSANERVYEMIINEGLGLTQINASKFIYRANNAEILDYTDLAKELVNCDPGQYTKEYCILDSQVNLCDKSTSSRTYEIQTELMRLMNRHNGHARTFIGDRLNLIYKVSAIHYGDGGCTIFHDVDCRFSGDETYVFCSYLEPYGGMIRLEDFLNDKAGLSQCWTDYAEKYNIENRPMREVLETLKRTIGSRLDLNAISDEDLLEIGEYYSYLVIDKMVNLLLEKTNISLTELCKIFFEALDSPKVFNLTDLSTKLHRTIEVAPEDFRACYDSDEENQSNLVLDELLPKIEQELKSKFKGPCDEIIGIIEDEDFSKSFEEESDLYELDFVYESLAEKDKVVPAVADMGGILQHFKHSYDADTKTYHFKSYATYDTGQYGSESDEITDLDADDPFNLTTTKLANQCEEYTLADHDLFLNMLEEMTGEEFGEGFEVHEALCKLEEEDDEESYAELNDAVTECSRAAVKSLGVLNLSRDLKDFAIEFNIQL